MLPDMFGFGLILMGLLVLVALIWGLFWLFSIIWPVLASIAVSAGQGAAQNPYITRFVARAPKLFAALSARLDRSRFAGLPLTLLGVALAYFFSMYIGSTLDYMQSDPIVGADSRLANLFFAYRDPILVRFFTFITAFGASSVVGVLAIGVSLALLLHRRLLALAGLWISVTGSVASVTVLKALFARPRSDLGVYIEQSHSFPSGHANISIAFYGFLAYLVLRQHRRHRLPVIVAAAMVALLIGFSRVYLVEHYLTDVLNGYLVGSIWLLVAVMVVEWRQARHPSPLSTAPAMRRNIAAVIWAGTIATCLFLALSYSPPLKKRTPAPVITLTGPLNTTFSTGQLDPFTETVLGNRQEPTSLVILAKNDDALLDAFAKAGWLRADKVGFTSFSEAIYAAWFNGEYTAAPVTPSFWMKTPNAFGFQKASDSNSLRERHHARVWKTGLRAESGLLVYVGTASFDDGLKWGITHHIDPNIDKERDLLVGDLATSGMLESQTPFQLVPAVLGENFAGDPFFTDGKAVLMVLR